MTELKSSEHTNMDGNIGEDSRMQSEQRSEITEFFNHCNILITGASGFIGKLLVEKLLRTCPNMGKMYIMMRAKKGKTPEMRYKEHFDDPLYERLKSEQPDYAKHIVLIEGDTSDSNLGLSEENRKLLRENTHVVFHCAATVRFDEKVRVAVNINVRGTKLMLLFSKEMINLKAFVHVSTAFSHCILKFIDEKFYPPPMEVDKVLSLVEILDDDMLEHMRTVLIGKWPNTYAFSKALGEESIRQYCTGIPTCIVRPSIVIATYKDPVSGWINNLYGPTGVVVGAGIGLLRSLHCESTNVADIIPGDYVINNIVAAAWETAITWKNKPQELETSELVKAKEDKENDEPRIYNCVSSCQMPITWGRFMKFNEIYGVEVPSAMVMWYYVFMLNKHKTIHNICVFFLHLIPAVIVDTLARLTGREPMLLEAYKKIHKFSGVISYFSTQQWRFRNTNVLRLWDKLNAVDKERFFFHLDSLNWDEYFSKHIRGLRIYILKDPLDTIKKGAEKYRKLRIAHFTLVTVLCLLLLWAVIAFMRFTLSWCPYFN